MIRLEKFDRSNYAELISWVNNKETLMQFAGPGFNFPLTPEQLDISLSDKNRIALRIINGQTNFSIGHSEIYLSENSAKLGRILISDKEQRGKGLGQQVVQLLLNYAFSGYEIKMVELNVFDWNIPAIRCYEKAGFTTNPGKKLERKINDTIWIAINMVIDRERWNKLQQTV